MTWEDFERRVRGHGYTTERLFLQLMRQMRQRHPIVCDLNPPAWYRLILHDLKQGKVLFTNEQLKADLAARHGPVDQFRSLVTCRQSPH